MNKKQDKPARLTYEQIDQLTKNVAVGLAGGDDATARTLMVLTREIAENPFDHSYVETIANLMTNYLFIWTGAGDEDVMRQHVESYEAEVLNMVA